MRSFSGSKQELDSKVVEITSDDVRVALKQREFLEKKVEVLENNFYYKKIFLAY